MLLCTVVCNILKCSTSGQANKGTNSSKIDFRLFYVAWSINKKMLNSKLRLQIECGKETGKSLGMESKSLGYDHDSQLFHIPVLFGGTGIQQSHTQQSPV